MKIISIKARTKILRVTYLITLVLMIGLITAILTTRTSTQQMTRSHNYTSIDSQWTLTPGGTDYVDVENLSQYYTDGSDTLSIYWAIPDAANDECLMFRSKDVYCSVYVDDVLEYSTRMYESPLYNASPGNNWNFCTVNSGNTDKNIELQIKYIYGLDAVTADHFFWGNKTDWVIDFLLGKATAISLSLLIVLVGIIIISMDYGSYKRSGKHSLLYLGIYAILMGLWSLVETNTLQIVVQDGRLIQLIDNLLMISDSLPLFFYLDAEFDILRHRGLRILTTIDIIYIGVCVIGQFTGLTDLHNHLSGSWIATGLSFIILVCILIKQVFIFLRGEKIKKSVVLQIIGFVSLMAIVIISMPIFINSDGMDRAETIRLGMLVMVIMFAIAGQLQTYELILQGTRYDIVKNLAYQDALTGLSNRTSYLEALEKYRDNPPANLGVVFFDVNNLKMANDNYGHEVGDQLICTAAEIISSSFGLNGATYRTGGDEFIVFLEDDNPELLYRERLVTFKQKILFTNKLREFPFKVDIAHGFACLEGSGEEQLKLMIENADNKMYEDKKELKKAI